ncbi:MAG: hypothetical protein ACK5KO_04250 [Arachnia sp.]
MFGAVYTRVTGTLYLGLMTNLLLGLASLPFLALVVTTDPRTTWPLWAAAAMAAVPAVGAAFHVFARHSDESETAVVRPFLAGWWRALRRVLPAGSLGIALTMIVAVDIAWVRQHDARTGTSLTSVAVPIAAVLLALCAMTTLGCMVAALERTDVSLPRLAKAAVYLMVRRWYLTALSAACTAVFIIVLVERPAVAIGVIASPLLFVIWANTRRAMRPVLAIA